MLPIPFHEVERADALMRRGDYPHPSRFARRVEMLKKLVDAANQGEFGTAENQRDLADARSFWGSRINVDLERNHIVLGSRLSLREGADEGVGLSPAEDTFNFGGMLSLRENLECLEQERETVLREQAKAADDLAWVNDQIDEHRRLIEDQQERTRTDGVHS